jgi:hypothetical protein
MRDSEANVARSSGGLPAVVWAVPAAILLLALARLPYGYYQFVRLVVCVAACLLAWSILRQDKRRAFGWLMIVVALIYNPLFKVHLVRGTWMWVDLITAAVFLASAVWSRLRVAKS